MAFLRSVAVEGFRRRCDAGVFRIRKGCQHRLERIGGDLFRRYAFVDDLVDEGAVGAVFQEPAHEIGEEVAMGADGRIDPAARALGLQDLIMQGLAHAVQALEFKLFGTFSQLQDRGDGMGIVGGELRVEAIGHRKEFFC